MEQTAVRHLIGISLLGALVFLLLRVADLSTSASNYIQDRVAELRLPAAR